MPVLRMIAAAAGALKNFTNALAASGAAADELAARGAELRRLLVDPLAEAIGPATRWYVALINDQALRRGLAAPLAD